MSWIFGIVGTYSDTDLENFRSIHDEPLYSIRDEGKCIVAGGLKDTCLYYEDKQNDAGWLVCGLGISKNYTLLSSDNWKEFILKHNSPNLNNKQPDGHYICVNWNNNKIQCFNDMFGLRDFYITNWKKCLIFSTNLKWIAQFRGDCNLDLYQFGSNWLLFNQLSNKSVLSGIDRLGPNGVLTISNNTYSIANNFWSPVPGGQEDFSSILKEYILLPLNSSYKLSVGLSGGLDSRSLLSILLSSKHKDIYLHSFGNPQHPDVKIASQIASQFNLDHKIIYEPLPPVDSCLKLLKTFIATSAIHVPASEVMGLRYYLPLKAENKLVIDGGFGEIARRQYLNRLLLKGKEAIVHGDYKTIISYLALNRGTIFNEDALKNMREGILLQMQNIFSKMPKLEETGVENWLDIFSINTRLPNFFGFSQTCVDNLIMNYMPFAQPRLLNALFQVKVKDRKNGRLLKQIIKINSSKLTKFNLVKFNTTYPFGFSTVSSNALVKIKNRSGYAYQDNEKIKFLLHLSEFINDTVTSKNVKEYSLYDYIYITKTINDFYKGDLSVKSIVDWWLSFEIFRQNSCIKS